ncbi:MAG: hypothetical protein ACXWJB_09000 [Limisphaerales bacterium]
MKTIHYFGVLAASAVLACGCISHNETVTRDVERRKVEFENESAARIFYEALSHVPNQGTKSEKTSNFEIPVVFEYHRHVVTGPNGAFNESVERCDTNKDGRISETEAKIFADQIKGGGQRAAK